MSCRLGSFFRFYFVFFLRWGELLAKLLDLAGHPLRVVSLMEEVGPVLLLQVVAAVLLTLGSLLILKAISVADEGGRRPDVARPRLRVAASSGRKAKTKRPATSLPRAA